MLFKLLKYDFRAMWKRFSLIWGAALVLALINRIAVFQKFEDEAVLNADLPFLAFIGVIVAMFVIAIGFVIDRFSKGLLGDEGYLMHTLPVRSWQLVLSKLICGGAAWVLCGAVALATPFIMIPGDWTWFSVLFRLWPGIVRAVLLHPDNLLVILEFCLFLASAISQFIAAIYLSVSIGHLFTRRRKLIGIAAFIGLYALLPNLWVFSEKIMWQWMDVAGSNAHSNLLIATAIMLIPAAAFLAAVCWILDHKLNLE